MLDLPPFGPLRILTEWGLEPVPVVLTTWVAGAYLVGLHTLRKRGDSWPVGRTIAFMSGMAVFVFATTSGLAAYDTTLVSVHMVQHMLLSMLVPMLLALGAPVTLALRTLPKDPRRWLLAVLHSKVAKVLTFPALTFALYVISPWALYFSGWYEASLRSAYIHEMMHIHLVLVGSMFFWPLVGVDPIPGRVGYPLRMMLAVMTLPFHAFLGVTIMGQTTLLGGTWYPDLHNGPMGWWLPDPLADQEVAGGILWGSGDLVALAFFAALFAQWVRASMKEAARVDRALDRQESHDAREAGLPQSVRESVE